MTSQRSQAVVLADFWVGQRGRADSSRAFSYSLWGLQGHLILVSWRRQSALETRLQIREEGVGDSMAPAHPGRSRGAHPAPMPCGPKPALRHHMFHQAKARGFQAVLSRPENVLCGSVDKGGLFRKPEERSLGCPRAFHSRVTSFQNRGPSHDTHIPHPLPPVLSPSLCPQGKLMSRRVRHLNMNRTISKRRNTTDALRGDRWQAGPPSNSAEGRRLLLGP